MALCFNVIVKVIDYYLEVASRYYQDNTTFFTILLSKFIQKVFGRAWVFIQDIINTIH